MRLLDELITIMSTRKGFSRLVRFAGFGATCYGLYRMSHSTSTYVPFTATNLLSKITTIPGLKYGSLAAACAFAGYGWLSLFPSKVYAFQDDLKGLKLKHERLKLTLDGLEKRLKVAKEDVLKKLPNHANSV